MIKEGVLYKYKANDLLKLTGVGIVITSKGHSYHEEVKQTLQMVSLTRSGDMNEMDQLDLELENEIKEMEKNQERYVYTNCLGGIEQASIMSNYTPITSLF